MTNLSICIDAIFRGQGLKDALQGVSDAGFSTIEFWSWWDKDLDLLETLCQDHGITISACCTHFISLVDPSQRDAYLDGLRASIAVAKRLNCKRLISQVGNDTGQARDDQQASLIAGLQAAAPLLEAADIQLVFEPLNTRVDHAGYYLTSSDEAFEIAKAVNSPYIKVLFDIYHQQISEGDVIRRITANIDLIGHFHAAGTPGRHELNMGELHYPAIFEAIDQSGFDGFVGLEYFPMGNPLSGLKKLAKRQ